MRDYAKTIGRLIAMAEDESLTTETRASYRQKAEAMMREYRISEEETIAQDQFSIVPIKAEVTLMETGALDNPLRQHYADLWHSICRHAGVRTVVRYRYAPDGYSDASVIGIAIGYESDLKLAEFLWTAARLVFLTRIDARPNPEFSDQINCYFLRNSGLKRNDIAHALWGSAYNDGHAHGKVQRLYLAECAVRGETPRVSGRGIQVKTYREAYATGFVQEFGYRLRAARDAADSIGGALALPGRKERVDEAFYAEFPHARPMSEEEYAAALKRMKEEEDNCKSCKPERKCKQHRPATITEADRKRYYRKYESPEARAGQANGVAAAKAVNVERAAGERRQRTESAPERTALGN
jgi:hypothetical protein